MPIRPSHALIWLPLLLAAAQPTRADQPAKLGPESAPKDATPQTDVAMLESLTVKTAEHGVTLRLDFSAPREGTSHTIKEPYRVYFDFPATHPRSQQTSETLVEHPLLASVRIGLFSQEPPITRVVLQVPAGQGVKVARENDGKTWFIGVGDGAGRPDAAAPAKPTLQVVGTVWERETKDDTIYLIAVSSLPEVNAYYLSNPDRVVVDINSAELKAEASRPGKSNGVVAEVRCSQFSPNVVRYVFELKKPAGYLLLKRTAPDQLVLRLTQGQTEDRLIVVDAGHGGKDPGARGATEGLIEKKINLAVAQRVKQRLEDKGIRCAMTRDDDTFVPLYDRANYANRLQADLFVSIHCNAMPDSKKGERSGSEVYYQTEPSSAFASLMLSAVTKANGLHANGVYQRRFVVVRETVMPSVLVELGYLCHANDGPKLLTPEFQARCATGIVNGIVTQLQRQPRRETLALKPAETAQPTAEGK